MPKTKLTVQLLSGTCNPLELINIAGHLCYSDKSIDDLSFEFFKDDGITEKALQFIRDLIKKGHLSVLEHVMFTFGIEGISRACSHQLVRHRICSISQRSQRYVSEKQFDYIIPESIKNMKTDAFDSGEKWFYNKMAHIQIWYNDLIANGVPKEDARSLLPNACATSLIMTMNVRELHHFFTVRCCSRAQSEIQNMAMEMLKLVKKSYPALFENIGPNCVSSSCKEGAQSCGQSKQVKIKFLNL